MSDPGMIGQEISNPEYEGQIKKMVGCEDQDWLLARKRFTIVNCLSSSPKRAKSQMSKFQKYRIKRRDNVLFKHFHLLSNISCLPFSRNHCCDFLS